jgi:hypothetical protein
VLSSWAALKPSEKIELSKQFREASSRKIELETYDGDGARPRISYWLLYEASKSGLIGIEVRDI